MGVLKRIEIEGYRSIKKIQLDLKNINIVIGPNGAGKSNFISFFKLLTEMMGGRLQQYIGMTGRGQSLLHFGPKVTTRLTGRLQFHAESGVNRYEMALTHAAIDTLIFEKEVLEFHREGSPRPKVTELGSGHAEANINIRSREGDATAKFIGYVLKQCRVYHFHDTSPTARLRQFAYINDNIFLMPDAGNLAAMLFAYRERTPVVYRRIVATIRKIVPEFDDFDLEPSRLNPQEIILNWRKVSFDYLFGPHQISDGSLRSMALCTLFLQPEKQLPSVIILDEPELGLHPHALEIVAGLIRSVASRTQVIAATQSQNFLNYFEPEEIITANPWMGETHFHRLDAAELTDWLDDYSIGELWQRNVLGWGPLP